MIILAGKKYELIKEHRSGWDYEKCKERFSEVLERYDYIVGDWGYNQLRLKGFFKEGNNKGGNDPVIEGFQEYIDEYCNFGCAYFVIEKS